MIKLWPKITPDSWQCLDCNPSYQFHPWIMVAKVYRVLTKYQALSKYFIMIYSFDPCKIPFYRGGNWGTEEVSNCPSSESVNGRTGIWAHGHDHVSWGEPTCPGQEGVWLPKVVRTLTFFHLPYTSLLKNWQQPPIAYWIKSKVLLSQFGPSPHTFHYFPSHNFYF